MNFLAYSVRRLGQLAWREGDYEKALRYSERSYLQTRAVRDPRSDRMPSGFAAISIAQRKYEQAVQLMAAVETQLTLMAFGSFLWTRWNMSAI